MRVENTIACLLVASDCAARAAGVTEQSVFAAGAEWVWWFGAFSWLYFAYRNATRRAA